MIRTAYSLSLALLLAASAALAGDDSWYVKVVSATVGEAGTATLVVAPIDKRSPWKGCSEVTINLAYKPDPTWSAQVKKSKHRDAFNLLRAAATSGAPIRLGSMGKGFGKTNDKCVFESRGIAPFADDHGKTRIYSFNDPL